jgi:hypothetical protein
MQRLLVATLVALVGLSLWPLTSAAQSIVGPATAKNRGGAVTVEAKYLGTATAGTVEAIRFEIKLDTHSVNLDRYDLKQLATLRNDRGVAVKPLSFEKTGSGHHIQNVLAFPSRDEAGKLLAGDGAKGIELVLFDIADVPQRVLRWELK